MDDIIPNKYKTSWRRFFAVIIDDLIIFPILLYIQAAPRNEYTSANQFIYYLAVLILSSIYFVWMTGRSGQTVGKKVTKIIVVDGKDETKTIGYKRSFYRYSPFMAFNVLALIYIVITWTDGIMLHMDRVVLNLLIFLSIIWTVAEFITILGNGRRKAIHDYIGGSVVIRKDAIVSTDTSEIAAVTIPNL